MNTILNTPFNTQIQVSGYFKEGQESDPNIYEIEDASEYDENGNNTEKLLDKEFIQDFIGCDTQGEEELNISEADYLKCLLDTSVKFEYDGEVARARYENGELVMILWTFGEGMYPLPLSWVSKEVKKEIIKKI